MKNKKIIVRVVALLLAAMMLITMLPALISYF